MKPDPPEVLSRHTSATRVGHLVDSGEEFERQLRRVYNAVLSPGALAIDVGAHTGKHTIPLALAVGTGGSVLAVEPNPNILPTLETAIANLHGIGGDVRIFKGAASDGSASTATFSVIPDRPGWSSLMPRPDAGEAIQYDVQLEKLDRLVDPQQHTLAKFIKIDCEGAELQVLAGATELLAAGRPVVHIEVSPMALVANGTSTQALADYVCNDWLVMDVTAAELNTASEIRDAFDDDDTFDYFLLPKGPDLAQRRLTVRHALLEGFGGRLRTTRLGSEYNTTVPDRPVVPESFRALDEDEWEARELAALPFSNTLSAPRRPRRVIYAGTDSLLTFWGVDGIDLGSTSRRCMLNARSEQWVEFAANDARKGIVFQADGAWAQRTINDAYVFASFGPEHSPIIEASAQPADRYHALDITFRNVATGEHQSLKIDGVAISARFFIRPKRMELHLKDHVPLVLRCDLGSTPAFAARFGQAIDLTSPIPGMIVGCEVAPPKTANRQNPLARPSNKHVGRATRAIKDPAKAAIALKRKIRAKAKR